MAETILISDSICSGTPSAISSETKRIAYQLTTISGNYVYDMANAGHMVLRRHGFPKSALSGGLRDRFMVVKDTLASSVIIWLGGNDLFSGASISNVVREIEWFAISVMKETFIPKTVVVVGHISTLDEVTDRSYIHAYNTALQASVLKLHTMHTQGKLNSDIKYINGYAIAPCSTPNTMADGVHRNDAGMTLIANGLNTQLASIGVF